MTAPVDTDDLVQGVVKYLSSLEDVKAVVGFFAGTATPFLFQRELWEVLEGTSSTAAVFTLAGGWNAPNDHNTLRFPRLSLEIYADPQRDSSGNVTDPAEVYRRADHAFKVIDLHLHRPQRGTVLWGTVRTVECTRLAEPLIYDVPDGNGLVRLQSYYGVVEG